MITRDEILMGRDKQYPLDTLKKANLISFLHHINLFRTEWGKPMICTSGYRPGSFNKAAGGAKLSAHESCEAGDFADPNGDICRWVMANLWVLEKCDVYMEDPRYTHGPNGNWIHLSTRAPASGRRVFIPDSKPPQSPNWA